MSNQQADFDTLVLKSPLPVLVSFESPWSRAMVPRLGRLTEDFAGQLRVVHVDVAANPSLAARFGIRVVPTFLIFRKGVPVEFIVGVVPFHFVVQTVSKALGIHPTREPQQAPPFAALAVQMAALR